jgi:hypothetical protein
VTTDRDPRARAPDLAVDLTRPDDAIHRDLRDRWPREVNLWWELDPDERSGWVYGDRMRILARLVHHQDVHP